MQESLGATLRAERERVEMSLAHMALITRIPVRLLALLEAGQFEALPGDVFVRGYITAYANTLRLDTHSIIERYRHCATPPVAGSLQVEPIVDSSPAGAPRVPPPPWMTEQAHPRKRFAMTFAVILLLIVATLTISYFLRATDSAGDGVTVNCPNLRTSGNAALRPAADRKLSRRPTRALVSCPSTLRFAPATAPVLRSICV